MSDTSLIAYQACFVVENVSKAVEFCEGSLGWGPFQHFKIPSPEAEYKGWRGKKLTEVALGMAGKAQVELIHVHEGQDAIEQYQRRMGNGLQHLGVLCKNTDAALAMLEPLGSVMNDRNSYGEITFTFVDVLTGPAMIELLERGEQGFPTEEEQSQGQKIGLTTASRNERLLLDRASIITNDIDQSAHFFATAFNRQCPAIDTDVVRFEEEHGTLQEVAARRCFIDGGVLQLELIEVKPDGNNPYALQLQRAKQHSDHGLMHIGGKSKSPDIAAAKLNGTWLNREERFTLCLGPDARLSLQLRSDAA